jgi:hypothetical protein
MALQLQQTRAQAPGKRTLRAMIFQAVTFESLHW